MKQSYVGLFRLIHYKEDLSMYETTYYNTQQGYGYNYANPMFPEPMKPALMTQALTPEEMSILTDKGGAFSTKVTREDMYKAYCTHKRNGKIVATSNPDGTFTCPICGETFEFRSLDKDAVTEDINKVIDDMQTIKLTFLDMGVDVARQYFPIIPLLKKLPQLAVMAANNWAKYESPTTNDPNVQVPYGMAAYNQIMGGGAMMAPMMGYYGGAIPAGGMQPPLGMPMPQPVYVDAYGRPIQTAVQTGGVMMPQPGQQPPATSNPAQAAMMMAPNEFVATATPVYPAGVQPAQMVTPPVIPGAVAATVTPPTGQQALAPTTYSPQPQVTVNVNSGDQNKQQPAPAPTPAAAGAPVVDVASFKV